MYIVRTSICGPSPLWLTEDFAALLHVQGAGWSVVELYFGDVRLPQAPAVFVCLRWVVCVACTPRTPTMVVCTYPGRRRGRGRFSSVLVLAFVFAFRIGSYFLANTIHPSLPPRRGIRGALMSGDSWVSYFTRDDESSNIPDCFEADEWTRLLVVGIKTIAGIDWESMVISRAGLSHNDYHVVVDSIF